MYLISIQYLLCICSCSDEFGLLPGPFKKWERERSGESLIIILVPDAIDRKCKRREVYVCVR